MSTLTDQPRHPWFYTPTIPQAGESCALDPREAQHASGARRLGTGDPITLFDGHGLVAKAAVESVGQTRRDGVAVLVNEASRAERHEPACHVIVARPKGDRLSTMLSMVTQLGAASITLLSSQHGIAGSHAAEAGLGERAERICIEACKQSRNPWLPTLGETIDVSDLCSIAAAEAAVPMIVAHPGVQPLLTVMRDLAGHRELRCVIGPEGGLAEDEVAELRDAGARIASLGETILRIETAAVVLCAAARTMIV